MNDFHFLRPGWLLALPPLLILLIWLWRKQLRSRSWQKVCDPELLPHLLLGRSRRRAAWPLWLVLIATLLSVLALAGPAWHRQPQPLFRQQSALVILLDLSRSMSASDLKPSRLERARLKVEDLLNLRREGQTALIAFAGDAFVVTPLTDDQNTIRALLQSLNPELMPVQGSDPQRAIELGLQLLQQAGLKRGRLLLVTDEDRPNPAMDAARKLPSQGVTLSVLGVGTPEGAPIPLSGGGFLKDNGGDLVLPKLDEAGLKRLAEAGGGSYRSLSVDDRDLRGLLAGVENHRLDQAEQAAGKQGQRWREEGVWLLLPLALLASLAFRRGWLLLLVLLMLRPLSAEAFTWQDLWQRPDQQAAKSFAEGDYQQAGKMFQDPGWKAGALYRAGDYQAAAEALQQPKTAEDWYNRGNALARAGQLLQALEAYRQTLHLDPEHADARTNQEVVEKALKQQQQQQQQQQRKNDRSSPDKQSEKGQEGQSSRDSQGANSQQQRGENSSQQAGESQHGQNRSPSDQNQDSGKGTAAKNDSDRKDRKTPADSKNTADSRRNADDSAQGETPAQPSDKASEERGKTAATTDDEQLTKEEQRALQQWLQQIPDDPGGLLRRKFLYQYRQRGRQLETDRPW
jgi:Ca-activated chloride channel family protein